MKVEGNRSRERPKKYLLNTIKDDLRQSNLKAKTFQNGGE